MKMLSSWGKLLEKVLDGSRTYQIYAKQCRNFTRPSAKGDFAVQVQCFMRSAVRVILSFGLAFSSCLLRNVSVLSGFALEALASNPCLRDKSQKKNCDLTGSG